MAPAPWDGAKPYTRRAEMSRQPPPHAAQPPRSTPVVCRPAPVAPTPRSTAAPRPGEGQPPDRAPSRCPRRAPQSRPSRPEATASPGCPPRRNRPPSRPCRAPAPAPAKPPPRARRDRLRSRAAPPRANRRRAVRAPAKASRRVPPPAPASPPCAALSRFAPSRAVPGRRPSPGRGDQIPVSLRLETAAPSRVNFREIRGWGYEAQKQKKRLMARSDAVVAQLAEQPPCKRQIRGSRPRDGSI